LGKIKPQGSILLIEKPISLLSSEPEPDIAIVKDPFTTLNLKTQKQPF